MYVLRVATRVEGLAESLKSVVLIYGFRRILVSRLISTNEYSIDFICTMISENVNTHVHDDPQGLCARAPLEYAARLRPHLPRQPLAERCTHTSSLYEYTLRVTC